MKVYWASQFEGFEIEARDHPWSVSMFDKGNRYYNFVEDPELIRTSLEDFLPWSRYKAIESFYKWLEWLNGNNSVFESNDSAFSGVEKNTDNWIDKKLRARGRCMILFRKIELNIFTSMNESLIIGLNQSLKEIDLTFEMGVVGLSRFPTYFVNANVIDGLKAGFVISINFSAWGNIEDETMINLDRVFLNINRSTKSLS